MNLELTFKIIGFVFKNGFYRHSKIDVFMSFHIIKMFIQSGTFLYCADRGE